MGQTVKNAIFIFSREVLLSDFVASKCNSQLLVFGDITFTSKLFP